MKKFLIISFILLLLSVNIFAQTGSNLNSGSKKSRNTNKALWTDIFYLYKTLINTYLTNSSEFTIQTKTGKNLLYTAQNWSYITSHVNFKIDNHIYTFFETDILGTVNTSDPTKLSITYVRDLVLIKLELIPIENIARGDAKVLIKISFTNNSATTKNVGALLHLDTQVGLNDDAKVFMNGTILQKAQQINPIPDTWKAYEDYGNPDALIGKGTIRGIINGTLLTPPNYLYVGSWSDTRYIEWDEAIAGTGVDYGDSEILMRWNQVSIAPGATTYFATLYGLGELDYQPGSSILLDCDAIQDISVNSQNQYEPNPIDFTANVKNIVGTTFTNVKGTIEFDPNVFELSPTTDSKTKNLNPSTLYASSQGSVAWKLRIKDQGVAVSSPVKVTITADNITDLTNFCTKNINIPAIINSCQLTTSVNDPLGGIINGNSGSQSYTCGSSITISAVPNNCYRFTGWTGDITSTSNPLTFALNNSKNIVANFEIIKYNLAATATPPEGGKVNGTTGQINCGDKVNLTAEPNSCYRFTGWSLNGTTVSTLPTYSITMDSDKNILAMFEKSNINLTTQVNPAGAGAITGNSGTQSYTCGTVVNLSAAENNCYKFVSWTLNGNILSNSKNVSVTTDIDKTVVANYEKIKYNLTTNISPPNTGSVTENDGTQSYDCGSTLALTAVPSACYKFINWTKDGVEYSTKNPLSITMDEAKSLTANFDKVKFFLTTSTDPAIGGTINGNQGSQPYNCNDPVKLTATPNNCYKFLGWYSNTKLISSEPTYDLSITTDLDIIAKFEKISYSLLLETTPDVGGKISGNNTGSYDCGSPVSIAAIPNSCYNFTGWTGDTITSQPNLNFTMNSNKTLRANFQIKKFSLTTSVNLPGSGIITGNSGTQSYDCDSYIQLNASPQDNCYEFINWTGDTISNNPQLKLFLRKNINLTANFRKKTFMINTLFNPSEISYIERIPPISTKDKYECGESIKLIAHSTSCYKFKNWSGDNNSTDSIITITFDALNSKDVNLTANCDIKKFTLSLLIDGDGIVSSKINPNGTVINGTYNCGDSLALQAFPNHCFVFSNWNYTIGGETKTNNNNILGIRITDNTTIKSIFNLNKIKFNPTVNITGSGIIVLTPNKTDYDCDESVVVEVQPDPCYNFLYWSDDITNTNRIRTIKLDTNKTIQAIMQIKQFTLTTGIDIAQSGNIIKNPDKPVYNCGEQVNLTIKPNSCFSFVSWSGNSISTNNSINIIIDTNKSYTAIMSKLSLAYNYINTSNLPNIILNFEVDSTVQSKAYPITAISKSHLTLIDSSCSIDSAITDYNLLTNRLPYRAVYDVSNKCISKACDTARYATILWNRDGCQLSGTLLYTVPLNSGCDSCSRIIIRTDTVKKYLLAKLFTNSPNPFNPETKIRYSISAPNFVNLKIYDILGREITTIVNEFQESGTYEVTFLPKGLPTGIYFYCIKSGDFFDMKKMIYTK